MGKSLNPRILPLKTIQLLKGQVGFSCVINCVVLGRDAVGCVEQPYSVCEALKERFPFYPSL